MFKDDDRKIYQLSLALAAAMCVLPFLVHVHRMPIPSFYGEWLAFALGLAALLPLIGLGAWRGAALPVVALFPVTLVGWLLVQWGCGRAGAAGPLPATLYLLWFAALIMLGAALRRRLGLSAAVALLAWALFLGNEVSALVGLIQHYRWDTPFNYWIVGNTTAGGRVYGNLTQPNLYADYLALGLVSGIHLYARGRFKGWVLALAAAPLLFTMALSGSRSAFLFLGALPLLALLLMRCRAVAQDRRWLRAAVCALVGFALAQWLTTLPWLAPAPVETGAVQMSTSAGRLIEGGVDNVRKVLWEQAWQMFLQEPWLGTGMGGFAWKFYQFQASVDDPVAGVAFNHTHNLLLQWLVEAGLAGGLLVLAAFALWARDLWRSAASLEDRWLFSVVTVIGIHSMLEYPLWYGFFLGIFGLVFGLGATRFLAPAFARAWRVTATAGLLSGGFLLVLVFRDYRAFEQWRFPPPGREAAAARHEPKWRARTLSALGRDPVLTPYIEAVLASDIAISAEHLEQKLALNTRAMHFMPHQGMVYRQALLLAQRGAAAAAAAHLAGAMRAYPAGLAGATETLRTLTAQAPEKYAPLLELALARAGEKGGVKEKE